MIFKTITLFSITIHIKYIIERRGGGEDGGPCPRTGTVTLLTNVLIKFIQLTINSIFIN